MDIRYAKKSDKQQVISLWNYCFEDTLEFVNYYFENIYDEKNTIVIEEDNELLSSLQLNKHSIRLRNNDYNVSYVVGVSSKPEIRGLGYMKKLMIHTLSELYKRGEVVSLLMAIDYRLYKKYGFEHCYDQIEYNINTQELCVFKLNSRLKKATKCDTKILSDIYFEAMNSLNGYTLRNEEYFSNFINEIECENGYVYIYEDEGNKGYIAYYINNNTFIVRELIYNSISSLKSILAFIYNHNTQCKNTIINTPINDSIRFIIPNLKTCEMKLIPFMAGRVINLKKYFQTLNIDIDKLKNINGKSINIKVRDKYIKENDGVFKISVLNNTINIDKIEENYNIELDINSISQLAFSYLSVDEIFTINEIDTSIEEKEILNILFEKKYNYIDELV